MINDVLEKIAAFRLVPVVKIESSEDAVPLGQALQEARLPIAEITFRTAAAEAAIRSLTAELPDPFYTPEKAVYPPSTGMIAPVTKPA